MQPCQTGCERLDRFDHGGEKTAVAGIPWRSHNSKPPSLGRTRADGNTQPDSLGEFALGQDRS